jgi:hypothetical protein
MLRAYSLYASSPLCGKYHRCGSNHAKLCATFRVREANAVLLRTDPLPLEGQRLPFAETGGVFPLCCGLAKHLPELTELVGIQPPLPPFSRKLSNPLGWVSQDNLQAGGMTEKASQGSDRTARDAGAAGCSAAPALSPARRLAGCDVGLHPFDIIDVRPLTIRDPRRGLM